MFSPSKQAECTGQYYNKQTQSCTKSGGRALGEESWFGASHYHFFQIGKFHRGVVLPCGLLPENDDETDRAIKFIGLHVTSIEGGLDMDHSVVVFFIFKLSCKQRHCRIACGNFYKNILCTYSADACAVDLRVQLRVCCERKGGVCAACCTFVKSLVLVRAIREILLKSCCFVCIVS